MEPGPLSYCGDSFLAFCLVALASAAEYALADLNRGRIRHLAEEGDKNARRLESISERPVSVSAHICFGEDVGRAAGRYCDTSLWSLFLNPLQFGLVALGTWMYLSLQSACTILGSGACRARCTALFARSLRHCAYFVRLRHSCRWSVINLARKRLTPAMKASSSAKMACACFSTSVRRRDHRGERTADDCQHPRHGRDGRARGDGAAY